MSTLLMSAGRPSRGSNMLTIDSGLFRAGNPRSRIVGVI